MTKSNYKTEPEIISQDQLKTIFEKSLFYTETEVEEQAPCLWVQEPEFKSTVASFGNISTIVGKPKAGKTFIITTIASALLKNEKYLMFTGSLPEGKNKVLFIDTEQSKRDCKKVSERLSLMTGTPGKHPENLIYLRLRGNEPQIILQVVEYAISSIPGIGAVIIDGIKDLVYSINDEREATMISSKLLNWSETKGIHIITVIHQNKGADNNTRGHIGTELENKSETVISVEKDQKDKGLIIVNAKLMRNKEFEPFAFRINNDGLPELSEYGVSVTKSNSKCPSDYSDKFHLEVCQKIFPENNNCSKNELNFILRDELKKYDIDISDKPAREFIDYYIDKGIILNKTGGTKGKYVLNEKYSW